MLGWNAGGTDGAGYWKIPLYTQKVTALFFRDFFRVVVLTKIPNYTTKSPPILRAQKGNTLSMAHSKATVPHTGWCSKNQHSELQTPYLSALAALVFRTF